jgi:hypothetical protein
VHPAEHRGLRELYATARRLRDHWRTLAAVALGEAPDSAIAAATPGLAGRLGHGTAMAVGAAGEWVGGRAGRAR